MRNLKYQNRFVSDWHHRHRCQLIIIIILTIIVHHHHHHHHFPSSSYSIILISSSSCLNIIILIIIITTIINWTCWTKFGSFNHHHHHYHQSRRHHHPNHYRFYPLTCWLVAVYRRPPRLSWPVWWGCLPAHSTGTQCPVGPAGADCRETGRRPRCYSLSICAK